MKLEDQRVSQGVLKVLDNIALQKIISFVAESKVSEAGVIEITVRKSGAEEKEFVTVRDVENEVTDATCISCVVPVDATLVISQYEDDQLQLMCTLEEFEQFGVEEATAR